MIIIYNRKLLKTQRHLWSKEKTLELVSESYNLQEQSKTLNQFWLIQ
jgi:hypothetical protein